MLLTSSQTPSPIQKGSQKEMLVVVVEVDGMVLSDSVASDMLELDILVSALDIDEVIVDPWVETVSIDEDSSEVGSTLEIEDDRSVSSWPEVDSEANNEELVTKSWVEAGAIDEASSEVDDSSCTVDVEMSGLVEYESEVIRDGDPEDEEGVDSSEVVMNSEEELDGCWEVENVVENEKVVLVMSMHRQSVQKSVTTFSRQQSPPS